MAKKTWLKNNPKVLIFIVSYNAETFIGSVLDRIPETVWQNEEYSVEILVIGDHSDDNTFQKVTEYIQQFPGRKITLLSTHQNQGYGGNQKLGYHYAIQHGFDLVVLLHSDGQYAPEYLEKMIEPILSDQADVVFGSRMINRLDALRGKMPLHIWVVNQVLTFAQNRILKTRLSEFHSGYRAYRITALAGIPFQWNSNYFDFDTDIIIQMIDTGQRVYETPIPTCYGDKVFHVNGWKYAALILLTALRSRLMRFSLLYDPRFDYALTINEQYTIKTGYLSSHQYALDQIRSGMKILDLGSGPGYMAEAIAAAGGRVFSVDIHITPQTRSNSYAVIEGDVENINWQIVEDDFDLILLLDIVEHLNAPEKLLANIRQEFALESPPKVIITTGNIGFFVTRLGLFLGQFNYGKRGILDMGHKRLFTFGSMQWLLETSGYEILEVQGIPAPFPEAVGNNYLSLCLLTLNQILIRLSRGMFAYQMAFTTRPLPKVEHLLIRAQCR